MPRCLASFNYLVRFYEKQIQAKAYLTLPFSGDIHETVTEIFKDRQRGAGYPGS